MGNDDISQLLLVWQASSAEDGFGDLVSATRGIIEGVARRVLHRHHIDDPAAVDDTLSLVFDHLRRLPPNARTDRPVSPFEPQNNPGGADAGLAYVTWLATERARDVARAARANARRAKPFSQLNEATRHSLAKRFASSTPPANHHLTDGDTDTDDDRAMRLAEAIRQLDRPLAHVLTRLLEGKSQAAIAVELRVCEGTVSRMRARAISQLRRMLRIT